MSSLTTHHRTLVAAMVLAVQLLGLGHVALANHTLTHTGRVADVETAVSDEHDEQSAHLCATDAPLPGNGTEDCSVLAGWRAPSLTSTSPVLQRSSPSSAQLVSPGDRRAATQLDALCRAPKASPPLS